MHRLLFRLLTLAALPAAIVYSQDLAGTWQGTPAPPNMNRDLNLAGVFHAAVLDRPAVDQTGISGRFHVQLKWTAEQFTGMGIKAPPPTDSPDAPPGLFIALPEQLGLKLTAAKAPVDVLVIDRAEKPSEN